MNSKTPLVAVVVPCRNEKNHIETCIRSILKQGLSETELEVIVADGMSDDGTREILDQLAKDTSCLRIVDNPGRIVSTGLNAAIKKSQAKIIIRMDVHTRYAPTYVRQCLSVLKETGADNVGGPARTEASSYIQSAICAAYHSPFSVGGARFHDVAYEGYVDTITYGCWPREIFDRIGAFDESLVRNQDDEFNLRLTRSGGKIWQSPRIQSWYKPRASFGWLFRQYAQYGYWKVRVIQKHKIPASLRHLVPGGFVFLIIGLPLLSLIWNPAIWIWALLLALYGITGIAISIAVAFRNGWRLLPILPFTFACFHFGYGLGFLRGIWDFMLFGRGPSSFYGKLTRPTSH